MNRHTIKMATLRNVGIGRKISKKKMKEINRRKNAKLVRHPYEQYNASFMTNN